MKRTELAPVDIAAFLTQFMEALNRRFVKHGNGAFVSPHEGLGVCFEEHIELIDAVKSNDRSAVREEAMDNAVAGAMVWMSVKTWEDAKGPYEAHIESTVTNTLGVFREDGNG